MAGERRKPHQIAIEAPQDRLDHLIELRRELAAPRQEATPDQLRWQEHPEQWVQEVLGAVPDPWQHRALRRLGQGKNLAIRSGHGVGKTTLLAWIVLWALDVHPGNVRVPCAAPTEDQLEDLLWPEVAKWLAASPALGRRIAWSKSRIAVRGYEETAFAVMRAAGPDKKAENLAGFHADYLLYIVDEASGVADTNMVVITGALSTEGAQLVMTGNPTRISGFFAHRFIAEYPRWYVDTVSCLEVARASVDYVASVADEWGEDSDEYRVRVLGLPPRGDIHGFFTTAEVEDAMNRMIEPSGSLTVGIDVARFGKDKTAFCARRGGAAPTFKTYSKLANPAVVAQAMAFIEPLVSDDETVAIVVDDGGVGGGVTDLFRVMKAEGTAPFHFTIEGVNFGGAGDKWYSTNAGVWWHRMRRAIRDGNQALPNYPGLSMQLTDRTSTINARGKTVLEPKEDMRKRGIASCDIADALCLTFATWGIGHAFAEAWNREAERVATTWQSALGPARPATPVFGSRPVQRAAGPTCTEHRFDPSDRCLVCGRHAS